MTGDTTLKTITDIITVRTITITIHTASEVHCIGAVITTHGIGTHGAILRGAITDGMTHSISEDGTTLGTMEAIMTLGIMADGAGTAGMAGMTTHITADGTEAGILTTTDISMVMAIYTIVL